MPAYSTRRTLGDITSSANNVAAEAEPALGKSLRSRTVRPYTTPVESPIIEKRLTNVFKQQLHTTPELEDKSPLRSRRASIASPKPLMQHNQWRSDAQSPVHIDQQLKTPNGAETPSNAPDRNRLPVLLALASIVGLLLLCFLPSATVPQEQIDMEGQIFEFDTNAFEPSAEFSTPEHPSATFEEPSEGFTSNSGPIYVEYSFGKAAGDYTHKLTMKRQVDNHILEESMTQHTRGVFAFNIPRPPPGAYTLVAETFDSASNKVASSEKRSFFVI